MFNISKLHTKSHLQPNDKECFVLMPGVSSGIDSLFMEKLQAAFAAKNYSYYAFDYPFFTERRRPSPNLYDEILAFDVIVDTLRRVNDFEKITAVAKSFGAVVATAAMGAPDVAEAVDRIVILGYPTKSDDGPGVFAEWAPDKISLVIQGEKDRFGSPRRIERLLRHAGSSATVISIPNADHSYRHLDKNGEPLHEDEAIKQLFIGLDIE